jgi:hypothetical protein
VNRESDPDSLLRAAIELGKRDPIAAEFAVVLLRNRQLDKVPTDRSLKLRAAK